jgi:integrase
MNKIIQMPAAVTQRALPHRFPFTEARLRREAEAAAPRSRPTFFDTETASLGMRLDMDGEGGTYLLYFKHLGRPQRYKLGRWPALTLIQAREVAKQQIGKLAAGIDLQAERRKLRAEDRLDQLWEWYAQAHLKHLRASTQRRYADSWRLHIQPAIGARRLRELNRNRLQELVDDIVDRSGPAAAKHVISVLSTLYNKAKQDEDIAYSGDIPTIGLRRPHIESRARFLQQDELGRFFSALEQEGRFWQVFWLACLYTGMRRGNVAQARWSDINLNQLLWTVPSERAKTGQVLTIHVAMRLKAILEQWRQESAVLIDQTNDRRARQLARNETTRIRQPLLTDEELAEARRYVFPAILVANKPSRRPHLSDVQPAWRRVCGRAQITDLRPHDLRRSLGSWLAIGNNSMAIIGAALGHRDLASTAIYARLSNAPVRVAVEDTVEQMVRLAQLTEPASEANPNGPA